MLANLRGMTPLQQLGFELQFASDESEAFLVWTRYRDQLRDSSLILSILGKNPFASRISKSLFEKGIMLRD